MSADDLRVLDAPTAAALDQIRLSLREAGATVATTLVARRLRVDDLCDLHAALLELADSVDAVIGGL